MIDIALDPITGDLLVLDGDLQTVKCSDYIRQSLKIRLQFFKDEWFLDVTAGLPYYQEILVKGADPSRVDALFKARIRETPGVIEILSYTAGYQPVFRRLKIDFVVRTDIGDVGCRIDNNLQPVVARLPTLDVAIADQIVNRVDNASIQAGTAFSDDAPLAFTAEGLPDGLSISPSSGVISGLATTLGGGAVTVTATDRDSNSVSASFTITVVNLPPLFIGGDVRVTQQQPAFIAGAELFNDRDGTLVSFSTEPLPGSLTIDPATGDITGDAPANGDYLVSIEATDDDGASTRGAFSLLARPASSVMTDDVVAQ